MALITLHLFNRPNEEIIINTDHVVSIEGANEGSTIVQLTAGQHRVAEDRDTVLAMLNPAAWGDNSHPALQLEYKKADDPSEPVDPYADETPAQRKARLKAEAAAAKTEDAPSE